MNAKRNSCQSHSRQVVNVTISCKNFCLAKKIAFYINHCLNTQASMYMLFISDVHKFVNVTLKSESLSKKAEGERTKLVEALEKFYASNYHLAPSSGDEGSTSSHKTPSISGSIGKDLKDDQMRNYNYFFTMKGFVCLFVWFLNVLVNN